MLLAVRAAVVTASAAAVLSGEEKSTFISQYIHVFAAWPEQFPIGYSDAAPLAIRWAEKIENKQQYESKLIRIFQL